ncbi:MAG: TIGR01457 family HAD-type hydrolase [Bacilli bacterium]
MSKYKGFLIDLDGTMYRGNVVIEEAKSLIRYFLANDLPYVFVTNNSTMAPEAVAAKLQKMGITADTKHVCTTSMACASYIKKHTPNARVYAIGEAGLMGSLQSAGCTLTDESPDYVVIGLDREITYEKLAKGALAIRNGATFISTNGDIAIPTERGLMPGNGSLTAVLTVTTETEPLFIGKPEPIIMEEALAQLGTSREETLMIGDNYNTDIMAGVRAGLDTLLVLSGVTTRDHLPHVPHAPTFVVDHLEEWIEKHT